MNLISSSIDFCEENYFITPYIAEFHNTWSSILMMIPPLFGLFYSNPTYEWRTTTLYMCLIFIFFGSTLFHATLHSFEQSIDEVFMLALNNTLLYSLWEYNIIKRRKMVISAMFLLTMFQIHIYYMFQHVYYTFLLQFISVSIVNVIWCGYVAAIHNNELYTKLYIYGISCYVFSGAPLWLIEMYICDTLLPYYRLLNGCTLHILWHIGSGLGGYFTILFITCVRLEALGGTPEIKWIFGGLCPVIVNNPILYYKNADKISMKPLR